MQQLNQVLGCRGLVMINNEHGNDVFIDAPESTILHHRKNQHQQKGHHKHKQQADFIAQQQKHFFAYGREKSIHADQYMLLLTN